MNVLIVDNDLGFQFWLAKSLEPSGDAVIPAATVSQATRLLRRLKLSLDVLIVNPEIQGAAEFTSSLRRRHSRVKVVALVGDEEKELALLDLHPDFRRVKPHLPEMEEPSAESAAESEWVTFLQDVVGKRTAGGRAN